MSKAGVLRCPSCGAPCGPKVEACPHCRAVLHPIRCPWCFDWTFTEARDCARCSSQAEPAPSGPPPACPSCRAVLSTRSLGGSRLAGCAHCGGVWADAASFAAICSNRETQAAYLGDGSVLPGPKSFDPLSSPVMYRPCPVCGELMNRFNFADCSGVVLDACKPHGVWFDPDELRRIVAFIRGGGLDMARTREREKLELERRRAARTPKSPEDEPQPIDFGAGSVASARALARFLLGA